MNLTINGETRDVAGGHTVLTLLEELGLKPEATVVERNAAIVDRERYGDTRIEENDRLELVRFVGGG